MKKKLSNFWYYHKWYILFALLVLWVVGDFLSQRASIVHPDAIVSFVTMQQISQETQDALRQTAAERIGDVNRDGNVEIEINVYAYDGEGSDGSKPEVYSASAVHLAAEIRQKTTAFFITDEAAVLADVDGLAQMGSWGTYSALSALDDTMLKNFEIYAFLDGNLNLLNALK